MIGIFTFVSLMSITLGMKEQISGILEQFLGAGIIVTSTEGGSRPSVPGIMIDQFAEIEGVDAVTGYIMDFMTIGASYASVTGVEPEKMELAFPIEVIEGRTLLPDDEYVCLTGAGFVGHDVGDKIYLSGSLLGSTGAVELTIVGKLASMGDPMADSGIIMPLGTLQELMNTENVQFVLVDCSIDVSESVARSIRDNYPDAMVIESAEIMDTITYILDLINVLLMVLAVITLTVGAIGIMNTTMMNVLERTREIGIIKSIGGTRAEVVEIFIMEAIIIAIIGGILGCVLAVVGVNMLSPMITPYLGMPMPFSFPPYLFIIAMLMATLIGFGASLYPSVQAASVRPVEALRYE